MAYLHDFVNFFIYLIYLKKNRILVVECSYCCLEDYLNNQNMPCSNESFWKPHKTQRSSVVYDMLKGPCFIHIKASTILKAALIFTPEKCITRVIILIISNITTVLLSTILELTFCKYHITRITFLGHSAAEFPTFIMFLNIT